MRHVKSRVCLFYFKCIWNMADIQYINYNDQQINSQDLLQNMANDVVNYVNNQPWTQKRKKRFLEVYKTFINNGIESGSVKTGLPIVHIGGETIDINSLPKLDREVYGAVADFVYNQMGRLTSQESEKPELPVFDNAYFTKDFTNFISTNYFGGRPFNTKTDWNSLDTRDENGLLPRTRRAEILSEALGKYADSLDENKVSFEGSPFNNIADFRARIEKARAALATPDNINDDTETLNALGLRASDWFNNGSGDTSNVVNPETGEYLTYGQLNAYNQLLAQQEQEALAAQREQKKLAQQEQEKLAQQELAAKNKAAYDNKLFFITRPGKFSGKTPQELKTKYKDHNSLLNALSTYSNKYLRDLTPDEYSELYGAYKYLTKGDQYKVNDTILNELKKISKFSNFAPNDWRMIPGINNIVYNVKTGTLHQIHDRAGYEAWKASSPKYKLDLFNGIKTKEDIQNTPIKQEGWTAADTADVVSIIGDLVSLGGFWFNVGGTVASVGADIFADINRGKDLGDILKNVGINLGFGVIGLIPGGKSTKIAARAARFVPKAFALAAAAGIILDPEVQKSAMKLTSVEDIKTISSKDLENIKYLFHAISGVTNVAKSHSRANNYRETINKQKIKTKSGETVKLTNKQVEQINKVGAKKGQAAAEAEFKKITREVSGKEYEIAPESFKFSETGKAWYNPAKYSAKLRNIVSNDTKLQGQKIADKREIVKILNEDKSKPWYNWQKGYAPFELTPFRRTPSFLKSDSKSNTPITNLPQEKPLDGSSGGKTISPTNNSEIPLELRNLVRNDPQTLEGLQIYNQAKRDNFSTGLLNEEKMQLYGAPIQIVDVSNAAEPRFMVRAGRSLKFVSSREEAQKQIFDFLNKRFNKAIGKDFRNVEKIKELGNYLRELRTKGILKQGGRIDKQKIQKYKDFINK